MSVHNLNSHLAVFNMKPKVTACKEDNKLVKLDRLLPFLLLLQYMAEVELLRLLL